MQKFNPLPTLLLSLSLGISASHAMQNPIYQGITSISLICDDRPIQDAKGLCIGLENELSSTMRLPVKRSSLTDEPPIGSLIIRMEIKGDRIRLVWENSRRFSGGPAKFEGSWVELSSDNASRDRTDAIIAGLLSSQPK